MNNQERIISFFIIISFEGQRRLNVNLLHRSVCVCNSHNSTKSMISISIIYITVSFICHLIFFIYNRKANGFICSCLFLTNWFRLILVYFVESCYIQSYFLHVLTHFHLHLIIFLRLDWYYYYLFGKSSQQISFRQLIIIILFIWIFSCLLTLPSLSDQWASIAFDRSLDICIVDYTFRYSYTLFILSLSCLIPYIVLCLFHRQQMKSSSLRKDTSSIIVLLWSLWKIILLILFHIPMENFHMKLVFYYIEILLYLVEPILYLFIVRSLSLITLRRSIVEIYVL